MAFAGAAPEAIAIMGVSKTMASFYIENFGCRATQADAAAIERQLRERGYLRAGEAGSAEVVVVNTCTVTASADSQARQAIRAIHRKNPAARILVTGCYAQRAPEELAQLDGVAWVVGNSHKPEIPRLLDQAAAQGFVALERLTPIKSGQGSDAMSLARAPAKILTGDIFEQTTVLVAPVLGGEGERTRPTLKIQDGCNNRCAYCVIPFVRGRSRSLPPERVIEEVRRLVEAGSKEVVLSGINLGSYGRDLKPRVSFAEVLQRILDETALERLRISSIEPMDVTRDLLEVVTCTERIARHFHLPLQSGSDQILGAMHRWYRARHYAQRLELIRELLPDAGVGADVIAGFPGEQEIDHRATLELVDRLPFTYLHVFAFSTRPGTEAEKMDGQVSPQLIRRRSAELRMLAEEKAARFRTGHIGKSLRVLTLGRQSQGAPGRWTEALSDNYLKVRVPGHWPANHWLDVRITGVEDRQVIGQPVVA